MKPDRDDELEQARTLAPVYANRVYVHPGAVTRLSFGEALAPEDKAVYRLAVALPAETALNLADLIIARLRPKGESSS